MQIVTIPTMKSMIQHVGVKHRDPLMFWGLMGIGKSEAVAQCAADNDAVLVDIRLSQYDSVDLRGIPVPSENQTVWHAPSTIPFKGNPRFKEDSGLIFLFLDEINAASPAVSAVAYQLINDRSVGEHTLMDNAVILAAGNRDQDRGVTNRQPAPLSNRFVHAELICDVKSWSQYAQVSGTAPPVAIAFLNFREPLLHTFDPEKPTEKAFATPRSWEKAFRYYVDADMPEDVKQAAMSGAVGEANAIEFAAFTEVWGSLTPIADIIAKPAKVAVPTEMSVKYAMAVHVSGNMTKDNADALNTYLMRMDPEFVVLAWTLALNRDDALSETGAFLHTYAPTFRSLFQAA
jgi:hypothetical protein